MGSAKSQKCTKALFELTNHCKKAIDKRNLIDQSVINAAIFARSSFLHSLLLTTTHFFIDDDTVDVVIITTHVTE